MDSGLPFTDPYFYSSALKCPDSLIEDIFRPSQMSKERIPLLKERIAILREVGSILCTKYKGSFQNLLSEVRNEFGTRDLAMHVIRKVVSVFPSFRDGVKIEGRPVYFWKRAQILVAETWAAFHPDDPYQTHPIFPHGVSELTMFADYRVPQILNRLQVIVYPDFIQRKLKAKDAFPPGSREEVSIRSASILAVEELRKEIHNRCSEKGIRHPEINSVLIDFWLWDTAKKMEDNHSEAGLPLGEEPPIHRTRSIWY